MADQKISSRDHRVIKALDKPCLCRLVKIDHDIPAEDHVKFQSELNRIHKVKCTEDHILFERGRYSVQPVAPGRQEIFLDPV